MDMTKEKLMRNIMDYHWMAETVRLSTLSSTYNGPKTTNYVDTIIKSTGKVSDPVMGEVLTRTSNETKYLKRYKEIVKCIDSLSKLVKQERDQYTLKRLLEGATLSDVAREVELSVSSIFRSKNRILRDMMEGI